MGGKAEATLWGFGDKAPAAWAAFVNGGLGHMLDYDDVSDGGHVSISTIPPGFAIAEKLALQGTHINGKDFLTAIVAGTDFAQEVRERYPAADEKVQLLGTFGGLVEIADPYGSWIFTYRRRRDEIRTCVEAFMDRLPPRPR